MPKLTDIWSSELSFVRRGANKRPFLFSKGDDVEIAAELLDALEKQADGEDDFLKGFFGDQDVTEEQVAAAAASYRLAKAAGSDELLKAMSGDAQVAETDDEEADDTDDDEDVCKAYDLVLKDKYTAEQRAQMAKDGRALPDGSYPIDDREDLENAIHAVGRGKNNSHAAIRAHIVKRAKALGATDKLPDSYGDVTKEESMTETAQAVPVKKEDGSWDLSAVPEEQRAGYEALMKAHDDEVAELKKTATENETKAEEALRIAKAEEEKRLTTEFIAKSADLEHIAKTDDEFGVVLRDISKAEQDGALPEGTLEKLETVLKAADEQIAKGDLYAEVGRGGHGPAAAGSAEAKVEAIAKALRDADPELSKEQAFAKALEQNPELYTEMRKETA